MSNDPDDRQAPPQSPEPRDAGVTVLADDDLRRGLEQRALRNSRGLIDKLEKDQKQDEKLQRYGTWAFVILAALVTVCLLASFKEDKRSPVEFPKPGFSSQGPPK